MNVLIEKFIQDFYNNENNHLSIIRNTIKQFYLNEWETNMEDNETLIDPIDKVPTEDSEIKQVDDENNEDETILDRVGNGEDVNLKDENGNKIFVGNVPSIYAFFTGRVTDYIKVGFTYQGVDKRLDQWRKHYPDLQKFGEWTATEEMPSGDLVYFMDYPVHDNIQDAGYARISKADKDRITKELNDAAIQENPNKNPEEVLKSIYVSNEFFRKFKKDGATEELSNELIGKIIDSIKEEIRNGATTVGHNKPLYNYNGDDENGTRVSKYDLGSPATYQPTPQQIDCIANGIKAIEDGANNLLMAAIMRFGKTHAAYQIIRQYNQKHPNNKLNYIVVTSAKADTRSAWRNDINHVDFIDDFVFIENFNGGLYITAKNAEGHAERNAGTFQTNDPIREYQKQGKIVVVYTTLQYLLNGTDVYDEDAPKETDFNAKSFNLKQYLINPNNVADLLIVDEAHYGSHAASFGQITGLGKAEYIKDEELSAADNRRLQKEFNKARQNKIQNKCVLQCSGTPYYILQSDEFNDKVKTAIITTVSFTDMIKARDKWNEDHPSGSIRINEDGSIDTSEYNEDLSPYFGMPNLTKFGMKLTKNCQKLLKDEQIDTKLSKLFKCDSQLHFAYENDVIDLMTKIFGQNGTIKLGFINNADFKAGRLFRHIVMILPNNNACHAMRKLLESNNIIDNNDRKIIVAVEKRKDGEQVGISYDAEAESSDTINKTLSDLEKHNKKSLTITNHRLLTGTSVPLWDAMFYMSDTTSAQEYDQSVFRLCTRRTAPIYMNGKAVTRPDGQVVRRVAKPNTYLIDFNIDRMFKMSIQAAQLMCKKNTAQAETKGEIQETLDRAMDGIPMYVEPERGHAYKDSDQILGSLHKVETNDLLRRLTEYNRNKSIEDQINDAIDEHSFDSFCFDSKNEHYLKIFGKAARISNKIDFNTTGVDTITANDSMSGGNNEEIDYNTGKPLSNKNKSNKEDKAYQKEMMDRMRGMIKTLLYCDICLDIPATDMVDFIKNADKDILKAFGIDDMTQFTDIWYNLSMVAQRSINTMLMNIYELMVDQSLKPEERAINAIKKLGRLDDKDDRGSVALVVTPDELVKKMIDKVPEEKMKNAKSILEINSKYGEFLIGIYKKYGKSVAEKVRIVPGDRRCKAFCSKILNLLGLNAQNNILELDDFNGNGKYDIRDFLNLSNEEIMSKNGNKKFDVCLMNPPYDGNLHLKFLDKAIQVSDLTVNISPVRWLQDPVGQYKDKSDYNKFEYSISKHIKDLEIISASYAENIFYAAFTSDLGIYVCDNNGGFDYLKISSNDIISKIFNKMPSTINDHLEFSIPKNAIVVSLITGGNNGRNNNLLDLYDHFSSYTKFIYDENGKRLDNGLTFYENRLKTAWGNVKVRPEQWNIKFNDIDECINFYNYTKLYLFRYLFNIITLDVNVQCKYLPFMNDYKHTWTNDELFDYFNISKEERSYIISYIDNIIEIIENNHTKK